MVRWSGGRGDGNPLALVLRLALASGGGGGGGGGGWLIRMRRGRAGGHCHGGCVQVPVTAGFVAGLLLLLLRPGWYIEAMLMLLLLLLLLLYLLSKCHVASVPSTCSKNSIPPFNSILHL